MINNMIITKDKEEIKIYLTRLRDLVRATYDSDILTTDDERALNFAIAYIEDRENLKFNNFMAKYNTKSKHKIGFIVRAKGFFMEVLETGDWGFTEDETRATILSKDAADAVAEDIAEDEPKIIKAERSMDYIFDWEGQDEN